MNPQHTGVFPLLRVAWIDDSSIADGLSDNTDKGMFVSKDERLTPCFFHIHETGSIL